MSRNPNFNVAQLIIYSFMASVLYGSGSQGCPSLFSSWGRILPCLPHSDLPWVWGWREAVLAGYSLQVQVWTAAAPQGFGCSPVSPPQSEPDKLMLKAKPRRHFSPRISQADGHPALGSWGHNKPSGPKISHLLAFWFSWHFYHLKYTLG
jgi:hypothetical protein